MARRTRKHSRKGGSRVAALQPAIAGGSRRRRHTRKCRHSTSRKCRHCRRH
jgi:hypothetical protein